VWFAAGEFEDASKVCWRIIEEEQVRAGGGSARSFELSRETDVADGQGVTDGM
jgi:hypothetical protein